MTTSDIPQGIARLREQLARLEADRAAAQHEGIRTTRLDRLIEAKRRALGMLEELAAGPPPGGDAA